jgi:hypothetical protein
MMFRMSFDFPWCMIAPTLIWVESGPDQSSSFRQSAPRFGHTESAEFQASDDRRWDGPKVQRKPVSKAMFL